MPRPKGYKCSPETIAKILATKKRTRKPAPPISDETRAKMSAAHKAQMRHGHSAETKAKISAANTGRRHTPEAKAKIAAAMTGKKRLPFTAETRARMSASKKAYFATHKKTWSAKAIATIKARQAINPTYYRGWKHTAETRAKMSATHKKNRSKACS